MKQLQQQCEQAIHDLKQGLGGVYVLADLEKIRVAYLGRNGSITQLVKGIKTIPADLRHKAGPLFSELKKQAEVLIDQKKEELESSIKKAREEKQQHFDVTAYDQASFGSLHPCTQVIEKIENVFLSMGYQIADGPEIETDFYNFEALNIPADHPARDMQDTFWLNLPGMLLRTQTSNVQIHTMQKQEPPIAIIAPGRVYRNESTDASHEFVFWQLEGLLVDENVSMSHLLATMQVCLRAIFEQDDLAIRVRPGYFPFVEPGIEIDMSCPFCSTGCSVCKRARWIEICGAGLVHPRVLEAGGIDATRYSGFAFGFGLTRLVMLKYGIDDIRLLSSGKLRFLEQF